MSFRDVLERTLDANCLQELGEVPSIARVDCLLDALQNAIISALDDQAPLRSFRVRKQGSPWFSIILRAEYRRFRDVIVAVLRRSQSDHCPGRLRGIADVWPSCGVSWRALGLSDLQVHLLLTFLPLTSNSRLRVERRKRGNAQRASSSSHEGECDRETNLKCFINKFYHEIRHDL